MTEVADITTFANEGSARLLGRAGSFCMERGGYQENDQGMIFFLPNMTWGQPPFYAHQMIHHAWQPQAVAVTSDAPQLAIEPRFSAQKSADGKMLVVRYVNNGAAQTLKIHVKGMAAELAATVKLRCYANDDLTAVNTPAEPAKVVPVVTTLPTSSLARLAVRKQSFIIVKMETV
jgi:alpha-L-arabinofuranosidase